MREQERIGELIQKQRKNKKITQMQLGQMLSVTKKAISDYELAKTSVIPFEKRVKLAISLDIDIMNLLYESEADLAYCIQHSKNHVSNVSFTRHNDK